MSKKDHPENLKPRESGIILRPRPLTKAGATLSPAMLSFIHHLARKEAEKHYYGTQKDSNAEKGT